MPEETTAALTMPDHVYLTAPIVRIDKERREVEGVATSEAIDSYGTIFSYEASKKAFQAWIERTANVREMHDRKAVGKGIGVRFDDEKKQVIVRTRVSKGAEDTWTKLLEGVLSGYSVGASNPVWDTIERNGKTYPYLVGYDTAELSYVDNASNPDGHGLALCRADGLTDLVDTTEPEPEATPEPETPALTEADIERAGAMHSKKTRDNLHAMRDTAIQTCADGGCEDCQKIQGLGNAEPAERALEADIEHLIAQGIERAMSAVTQRQQHFLARLASSDTQPDFTPLEQRFAALEQHVTTSIERVATASKFDEVSTELAVIKGQVERIAAQPMQGGPILNGARPVDKHLATDPPRASGGDNTAYVLEQLRNNGAFQTLDDQIAAAAMVIQPRGTR